LREIVRFVRILVTHCICAEAWWCISISL